MKVALIQESKVKELREVSAEDFHSYATIYEAVVDIADYDPAPEIGWVYDGKSLVNPHNNMSKKITRLALRNRFTMAELAGIYTAAKSNVLFQIYLDSLASATFIDLARADTIGNLKQLAALNLLTETRVNEILNNEIQEIEKYRG